MPAVVGGEGAGTAVARAAEFFDIAADFEKAFALELSAFEGELVPPLLATVPLPLAAPTCAIVDLHALTFKCRH